MTMRNTNRHESARMHTNPDKRVDLRAFSFVKIRVNSCRFVFLFFVLCMTGCDKDTVAADANALTGGDARKGAIAIRDHGCASCHTIPGIEGADAQVGPPLTRISQRTYLAGILQNTPENLVKWIQNPPKVDPQTAMPDMHLSESDARNIASYLYTLR
jgi:cytochrome c